MESEAPPWVCANTLRGAGGAPRLGLQRVVGRWSSSSVSVLRFLPQPKGVPNKTIETEKLVTRTNLPLKGSLTAA